MLKRHLTLVCIFQACDNGLCRRRHNAADAENKNRRFFWALAASRGLIMYCLSGGCLCRVRHKQHLMGGPRLAIGESHGKAGEPQGAEHCPTTKPSTAAHLAHLAHHHHLISSLTSSSHPPLFRERSISPFAFSHLAADGSLLRLLPCHFSSLLLVEAVSESPSTFGSHRDQD